MSYTNPAVSWERATAVVYFPGQSGQPLITKQFPDQKTLQQVVERWESKRGQGHHTYFSWFVTREDAAWQDLVAPGVMQVALKIENICEKIFVSVFCGACDLLTLPIRILTFVLGYRSPAALKPEDHPLYQDFIADGLQKEALAADKVCVSTFYLRKQEGQTKAVLEAVTKTLSFTGQEACSCEGLYTTCGVTSEKQEERILAAHLGRSDLP